MTVSRVALIGENSIGYVDTLIDIWNSGDCAVLLDWRIPFSTAIEMMIEADVRTCFIEKGLFNKIENEIINIKEFSHRHPLYHQKSNIGRRVSIRTMFKAICSSGI